MRSRGPLSFWHERPELNDEAFAGIQYFMTFAGKAAYRGPFDGHGVPLLDYLGDIGRQYNPIAIGQYGLATFNRFHQQGRASDRRRFIASADWLVNQLRPNGHGLPVWMHEFDWHYREGLRAPWYSGLAQGVGLSLLARAWATTGDDRYARAAADAFLAFLYDRRAGGVMCEDERGSLWIEEYLVDPASHILNGFIWALWGLHDYWRILGREAAKPLFDSCVDTLAANIARYDTGTWSLYELHDSVQMPASGYYHALHIVQLRVMHRLTGRDEFGEMADRWQAYADSPVHRAGAFARKAWFKLRHY